MLHTDLSAQFQNICDRANAANTKIQAANQQNRGQLPDLTGRPSEPSEMADHRANFDAAHEQASEQWQEIRDKWRGHLAKVRKDLRTEKAELDATEAMQNAGTAELYAKEAIDFAQDAIEEAEDAVLEALQARAKANALTV